MLYLHLLNTTPLSNKQRNSRRHPLQTTHTNPLIKPMNITTHRPIHHRRNPIIQTMHPRINIRRTRLRRQLLTRRRLMTPPQRLLRFAAGFEHVAFGEEAVPRYFRWVGGEIGVVGGEV
jgi:hypothetical protein